MNILAAFKGDYIAAVEFDGKTPLITIDHVKIVELEGEDGKKKARPVVYFRESQRGWVLCRTTAQALAALFGAETDKWTGKRVHLRAEEVQVGKEKKPGIRLAGSPDIEAPVSFMLTLPRRKPKKVTLAKTTAGHAAAAPEPDPEPSEPVIDPETGEVF
jgi:hypothetical protein